MASLTEKIQEACETAKRDGRELIVCVLDEKTEGLRVISTYDRMSQRCTMEALRAITEIYLADEEPNEKANSIIH